VSKRTVHPSKKPARSSDRYPVRTASAKGGALVRAAILAVVAIGGATWALFRHYTYSPPPLRVPYEARPTTRREADDPGTLQAPELLGADAAP
jgi:hypothetical protein